MRMLRSKLAGLKQEMNMVGRQELNRAAVARRDLNGLARFRKADSD